MKSSLTTRLEHEVTVKSMAPCIAEYLCLLSKKIDKLTAALDAHKKNQEQGKIFAPPERGRQLPGQPPQVACGGHTLQGCGLPVPPPSDSPASSDQPDPARHLRAGSHSQ